jgi:hypothetical protein
MKGSLKMKSRTFIRAITLPLSILIAGAFFICSAQPRGTGGVGITVYEDQRFRGKAATYTNDTPDLATSGMNDTISSFRAAPGERWEMCEHANYGGRCLVVFGEETDLRPNGFNDIVSSLRRISSTPVPRPPGGNSYIVLFDEPRYRGQNENYDRSTPDLYGMNGRAESVTVGGGTWQLCDNTNYRGMCIQVSQSVPDLASFSMRNKVRSVREIGSAPPPPEPPSGARFVVLYSGSRYRGIRSTYRVARPSISKSAGSVTIGGGTWQLCDARNYRGRCVTFSSNVPDLTPYRLGRTIRSLRPIGN